MIELARFWAARAPARMPLLGVLVLLGACTGTSPGKSFFVPQSTVESHGFSEERLSDTRYLVAYSGPEVITTNTIESLVAKAETHARETAYDLALWRAADLAVAKGYPAIALVSADSRVKQVIVGHDYRQNANPVYDDVQGEALGYQTAIYFRPEASITVDLLRTPVEGAYDAGRLAAQIRQKYTGAASRPIMAHTFYYFGPSAIRHNAGGGVRVEPPREGPHMQYAPYQGNKF